MDATSIELQITNIEQLEDKNEALEYFLGELIKQAPPKFLRAIINIDRAYRLSDSQEPIADAMGVEMYYELEPNVNVTPHIDINVSFDSYSVLDQIVDNLQLTSKEFMENKGTDIIKAKQLSAIYHVEITLNSDGTFTVGNIYYFNEPDIQNLIYKDELEGLKLNYTDFHNNVAILGSINLENNLNYKNLFAYWIKDIRGMFFKDNYVLIDTWEDLLKHVQKKNEQEENSPTYTYFIHNLFDIDQKKLTSILSQSQTFNISIIMNIDNLLNLPKELQESIFANTKTFIIGTLTNEEETCVAKYLPNINTDKNQNKPTIYTKQLQ